MRGQMQDYPLTVTSILRRCIRYSPDKTIVLCDAAGNTSIRWRDVGSTVAKISNALRNKKNVDSGTVVGSFAWNSAQHLALYFAVPCLGAVLHTINIRLHADHVAEQIREANDEIIFVDASLTSRLAPVREKLDRDVFFVILDDGGRIAPEFADSMLFEEFIQSEVDSIDYPELDENTAALLCYTSGTTGRSKGVLYSHRSEFLHALSASSVDAFAVSESDTILLVAPMFHANGWGMPYAAAMSGSSLVFTGANNDPKTIVDALVSTKATLAAGVPTIWIGVDEFLRQNNVSLPSLQRILIGGAPSSPALINNFAHRGIPILQGWGMTETSPNATIARIHSEFDKYSDEEKTLLRSSQGVAVPGVEIRICDEQGTELPWNGFTSGEVEVRGPWVADSYFRFTDEESAPHFHDGWLRTGDVGTIDEQGYLRVQDRIKDLIKSGGEWINSVELENQLMSHPAVLEAAVIAIPDQKWGERPAALVVLRSGALVSSTDLINHISPLVPTWWLPDVFRFGPVLPRTSVGKVDKKRIRAEWGRQV